MAADKMTVEMPAEAQMNTTISKNVLNPGAVSGGLIGPKPRSSSHSWSPLPPMLDGRPGIDLVTWLSRPTLNGGLAYTKRQMMPAPANEMAAGMKTSDLATFSPFMPSANRAIDSDSTVVAMVPTTTHVRLLITVRRVSLREKISA